MLVEGLQVLLSAHLWSIRRRKTSRARTDGVLSETSGPKTTLAGKIGRAPLLARVPELEQLRSGLLSTRLGEPRVYAILGEAGIGKTRMLDETALLAASLSADAVVFRGHSYDEAAMPPYLPWIEVAREIEERVPRELWKSVLEAHPEILPLLPRHMEDRSAGGGDPDVERLRLYDGVTRALEQVAADRFVLLIFDDIQWMDSASAALLRYVATHLSGSQVLILLAARDDELGANSQVVRAIEESNRQRRLVELPIRRMNRAETGQLVAELVPDADQNLIDEIFQGSEGNPFFIEELAKTLVTGSTSKPQNLPRGIQAIVRRSLGRLSTPTKELLEWAAIAGRGFDIDLIVGLSKLDPLTAGECLEEGLSRGVLKDTGVTNQLEFSHDRFRQGLLDDINILKKRRLHAELATALEILPRRADDQRAAELAFHFGEARQSEKAFRYGKEAAVAAITMHAYDEAVRQLRLLVNIVESGTLVATDQSPAALKLELADAEVQAGETSKAIEHYLEAARSLTAASLPELAGRAYRLTGIAHTRNEQPREALHAFRQALALLPESESRERALALSHAAGVCGLTLADYGEGIRLGREALSVAPAEDRQLDAIIRLTLAQTLSRFGNLAEAEQLLETALDASVAAADPALSAEICGALSNTTYWRADLERSRKATHDRELFAKAAGDVFARRHVLTWHAHISMAQGNWAAAEAELSAADPILKRLETQEPQAFSNMVRGQMEMLKGNAETAAALLAGAMDEMRPLGPGTLAWYLGTLAVARIESGQADSGRELLGELNGIVDSLAPGSLPRGAALGQLGYGAILLGDDELARRTYELLPAHRGQLHWLLMDRVLGMLAAYLGDRRSAETYFRDAEAAASAARMRPELIAIRVELAKLLLEGSAAERDQAIRLLAATIDDCRALGMRIWLTRAEALLAQSTPPVAIANPDGLSAREIEVLSLVVEGLGNREISERLFLSEKTVANHLTHIFNKIGVENRSAAVAYALRRNLA